MGWGCWWWNDNIQNTSSKELRDFYHRFSTLRPIQPTLLQSIHNGADVVAHQCAAEGIIGLMRRLGPAPKTPVKSILFNRRICAILTAFGGASYTCRGRTGFRNCARKPPYRTG